MDSMISSFMYIVSNLICISAVQKLHLIKKNQNIESYFHGIVYRVNKIVQERLFCFAGTRTEFTTFIQIRNRLEYHLHVKNLEAVYKNVLTASNQFMFIFFLAIKSIPNNLIFYE